MRLGVRGKLFLISFSMILITVTTGGLFLAKALRVRLENRIESDLGHFASAAREALRLYEGEPAVEALDCLADSLGRAIALRVTIIGDDGTVLGDSELPVAGVRRMENHGNRPEVQQAREQRVGLSRRYSTTLDRSMLYLAIPVQTGSRSAVVRIAKPLDEVDEAIGDLRWLLIISGLFALGVATLVGLLASHLYSRALGHLVQNAHEVAQARSGKRILVTPRDEIGGLIGSINQLSEELKQVVSSLATERDRFEAVLEGMVDGVLALDASRHITHVNQSALDLLMLPGPPIGKTLIEALRIPALHEALDQVSPGKAASAEFDLPADPSRRLLATATTRRPAGSLVLVIHDVSELRRLERVRQDFVANVSHELRTPVSLILANTETLLGGALDDPVRGRAFVEALQRGAQRLSSLISDLLDISRIDSGRYPLEIQSVAIASVVRQALEAVDLHAKKKEMSIEVSVDKALRACADEKALHQILLNLVDNAVKYTPRGGHIAIRAEPDADQVRVEVRDDGPGIAPKDRDRVFERFYRVDDGRSREMGGTGLGLSIVKNLVETMGGDLGMEPVRPTGSCFWFTLPPHTEPCPPV